ncbi:MAG: LAGLIDADG family homing endonuclease [Candidatus Bathyarchaeia archaeon]
MTTEKVEEIQRLVKSGLSLRGTARKTRVNYSTIRLHAKQFAKRQSTLDFSVFSNRELGYIVGFYVGDGSRMEEKRSGHYGAKFALDAKSDLDTAFLLRTLFEKSGKRVTLYSEGSWLAMKVYSKPLLAFLQNFVKYKQDNERTQKVLVDPSTWSRDFTLGFLGGLIDADGHVLKNKRKTGHFGAVITTVNPKLAQQLVSLLNRLGLEAKVGKAEPCPTSFSKKPTYFIRLGKAEFCKVCNNLICVKHQRCGCDAKTF